MPSDRQGTQKLLTLGSNPEAPLGKPFRRTKLATGLYTYKRVNAELSEQVASGNVVRFTCFLDL